MQQQNSMNPLKLLSNLGLTQEKQTSWFAVQFLCLTEPEKKFAFLLWQEALDAGADYAGLEEYVEKIKSGWTEIDVIIATPDVMGEVGKLGRILGPRGLMPNPKSGTVTFDVAQAVNDVKAGKIEYRVDKTGNIHASVGKCSFAPQALIENISTFYNSILRAKPQTAKGKYVKSIFFSSTMGPGVQVSDSSFMVKE
jgi:large subunit ribosomal protein L1